MPCAERVTRATLDHLRIRLYKWPIRARAYPSFLSMKQVGVFLLPLDGMLAHHRATPSRKFTSTHLHTWVKRGTVRVKCLAQEHNAIPWPGLESGPLNLESSALTIRPLCLPWRTNKVYYLVAQRLSSSSVKLSV